MRTREELMRGLSGRSSIPENSAMVFIHDPPKYAEYHMKDTLIPLQIAFLDVSMRIDKIAVMPHQQSRSYSDTPCPMVIEMNLGAFDRLGIQVGHRVHIDPIRLEAQFSAPDEDPESPRA